MKEWLTKNLDVDVSEFDFSQDLEAQIFQALNKTTITTLDWRFVAARLKLKQIYDECPGYSYSQFVHWAVEQGVYDYLIMQNYSADDLEYLEAFINEDYDLGFDYAGVNLLSNRYLMKHKGKIVERPQYMFMTLALMLGIPEKQENRLEFIIKTYKMLAQRKISLATPLLLNLRRPNGNLASCFITQMDDSLESIYHTLTQCAYISKNAGGVGVNLSKVRSKGARIKDVRGASGGVIPWIKLVNDTAVAVNQLGSRSGAITVALDVWHADIHNFLEMQTENGDHRMKAHDVFPQVVIPDLFMDRVRNDGDWILVDPHEVKQKTGEDLQELHNTKFEHLYLQLENMDLDTKKVVKAKDLFKQILRTIVETGMPYIFFKDTVNHANPNNHAGMIGNSNLCTESFSNFTHDKVHTCNLLSLNFAELEGEEFMDASSLSVRILDNAIELTEAPIPESNVHNNEYRILGIGIMGLADYLVKNKLNYSNCHANLHKLMDEIQFAAIIQSNHLALQRGAYEHFEGSKWDSGEFGGEGMEWDILRDNVKRWGMRNGGLFAIAPTTSTSLLMGATASILPPYSKFYIDKASNGVVPIAPPLLNSENMFRYKENKHTNQKDIIDVVAVLQEYVDQGISMELLINMQSGFSAKDLYDLYMHAWDKGLKTVYYVRSITEKQIKEDCVSCSG